MIHKTAYLMDASFFPCSVPCNFLWAHLYPPQLDSYCVCGCVKGLLWWRWGTLLLWWLGRLTALWELDGTSKLMFVWCLNQTLLTQGVVDKASTASVPGSFQSWERGRVQQGCRITLWRGDTTCSAGVHVQTVPTFQYLPSVPFLLGSLCLSAGARWVGGAASTIIIDIVIHMHKRYGDTNI